MKDVDEIAAENIDGTFIKFGPYAGDLWVHLPNPYLRFLAKRDDWVGDKASKILEKRGFTGECKATLTLHAIDRFSQRYDFDKELGVVSVLANLVNETVSSVDLETGTTILPAEGGVRLVVNKTPLGKVILVTVK